MKTYTSEEIRNFIVNPTFRPDILAKKDSRFPRISIITPSFNQAKYLERTILSVLNQNYPNLEYIVVDGGSTDLTVDIIHKYEKHFEYWVSEKDCGHADALRKGFEKATGDIFAFLNSDDLYLPNALSTIGRAFAERPEIDVAYGNMYRTDANDNILVEHRLTPFMSEGFLYGGIDLLQPATFWRARIFEKAGGMDPKYFFAFDTHLFIRFVRAGAKFDFVREFVACFRLHDSSKTVTVSEVGEEDMREIRATYLRYPFDSLYGKFVRNCAKLKRVLWHVVQGDFLWLVRRVIS